jgi:hypothetical protein
MEKMQTSNETTDLELKALDQFYGSQNWYKGYLGVLLTDGIKYISDNGYGWLVSDVSVIAKKLEKKEPFLSIRLLLENENKARIEITDGNDRVLYTQKLEYTDAKRELSLYFTDNILMLAREY